MMPAVRLMCALALVPLLAFAQTHDAVRARVQQERAAFLKTLEQLVSIESGSADMEGVARIGDLIANRLRELGGEVEQVAPPADMVRFENTPPQVGKTVMARFRGTGTKRILLLAHMDTVYARGMLKQQPFRIEGDRAWGLGIADDKHGVALILHTIATLKALDFTGFGLLTVLINSDEEVGSVGSRALITKLGADHDVVFSCEGAGDGDTVRLATAGIAAVQLKVKGRASHAGAAPERGRNALYELAHQIMQMRDLSDPAAGVKVNWTLAQAGSARNVIPADARATADVRVLHVADYERVEKEVRDRAKRKLIPDTQVEVVFERTRPPMEIREISSRLAAHAQRVYSEIGGTLRIEKVPAGGGTDAAFAALQARGAVIEGMGLRGFGAHSDESEYIDLTSIEPRLYLLVRLIMDVSLGKVA